MARIVEQLGGQLRVDSTPNEGSRFSFLVPVSVPSTDRATNQEVSPDLTSGRPDSRRAFGRQRSFGSASGGSELDSIVEALSKGPVPEGDATREAIIAGHAAVQPERLKARKHRVPVTKPRMGEVELEDSKSRGSKADAFDFDSSSVVGKSPVRVEPRQKTMRESEKPLPPVPVDSHRPITGQTSSLRVLIVEVSHALPSHCVPHIYPLVSRMMPSTAMYSRSVCLWTVMRLSPA